MNEYYLPKKKITIRHKDVLKYEKNGLSDRAISRIYDISQTYFMQIRLEADWVRKHASNRSDKGVDRVDPEEKRIRWNKYMRKYRARHPNKTKYVSHNQLLEQGYYDK